MTYVVAWLGLVAAGIALLLVHAELWLWIVWGVCVAAALSAHVTGTVLVHRRGQRKSA